MTDASMLKGKPLPKLAPRLENSPSILGAYRQILELEKSEQAAYNLDPSEDRCKRIIYARILGYLILEGPSDRARVAVGLEVNACAMDQVKMLAIGQLYFNHFIRAFKMHKGRTPTPSSHPSRSSFESRREMIMAMVVEAPQNHKQAKANALVRDGFRCVITGIYDANSVEKSIELEKEQKERDPERATAPTACAHIFPESTNANISGKNAQGDKLHYASSVWAVLDRFGYENVLEELNGSGIHRLENVITLDPYTHNFFDTLKLWLEPVVPDIPNTYKVCVAKSFHFDQRWKRTVTFTTLDPERLPVPSPRYLELHAACCRVANLSGAGEYIDKIMRDMEDIQVLSQDGASAEALQYALLPLSEVPVH